MADAQDENAVEKAQEAVRHELDEAEVAALMTVDEIKDTVHDAVEKVKELGHHHAKAKDESEG